MRGYLLPILANNPFYLMNERTRFKRVLAFPVHDSDLLSSAVLAALSCLLHLKGKEARDEGEATRGRSLITGREKNESKRKRVSFTTGTGVAELARRTMLGTL